MYSVVFVCFVLLLLLLGRFLFLPFLINLRNKCRHRAEHTKQQQQRENNMGDRKKEMGTFAIKTTTIKTIISQFNELLKNYALFSRILFDFYFFLRLLLFFIARRSFRMHRISPLEYHFTQTHTHFTLSTPRVYTHTYYYCMRFSPYTRQNIKFSSCFFFLVSFFFQFMRMYLIICVHVKPYFTQSSI